MLRGSMPHQYSCGRGSDWGVNPTAWDPCQSPVSPIPHGLGRCTIADLLGAPASVPLLSLLFSGILIFEEILPRLDSASAERRQVRRATDSPEGHDIDDQPSRVPLSCRRAILETPLRGDG